MVRAVLFDLDGTLLDTLADLADSCNAALSHVGFPARSSEEIRRFVGNGLERLMERAIPGGRECVRFDECLGVMRAHYAANCCNKTVPYDGVLALLATLKGRGVRCAVVSNKPDAQVKELCRTYFAEYVDARCALGDAQGRRRKPAADSLLEVMRVLGVPPDAVVYVGDSEVDLQTARNAGVPCVSATWGFREEAFLVQHGANALAHTPADVLRYI